MSEIKDYGEPWKTNSHAQLVDRTRMNILNDRDSRLRAVACVNALAGRDPAKLDALVEAVKRVSARATDMGDMCAVPSESIDGLDAALAAFEGGRETTPPEVTE